MHTPHLASKLARSFNFGRGQAGEKFSLDARAGSLSIHCGEGIKSRGLTTSWFDIGGGSGDGHKYLGYPHGDPSFHSHSSFTLFRRLQVNSIPSSTFFTYTPSYFKQSINQSINP